MYGGVDIKDLAVKYVLSESSIVSANSKKIYVQKRINLILTTDDCQIQTHGIFACSVELAVLKGQFVELTVNSLDFNFPNTGDCQSGGLEVNTHRPNRGNSKNKFIYWVRGKGQKSSLNIAGPPTRIWDPSHIVCHYVYKAYDTVSKFHNTLHYDL